jgi:hypothetical protein
MRMRFQFLQGFKKKTAGWVGRTVEVKMVDSFIAGRQQKVMVVEPKD